MIILVWLLGATVPAGTSSLERGTEALARLEMGQAEVYLERALDEGPYRRAEFIQLYEKLGILYAYLDRAEDARRVFDILLALDPGHILPYTLSPKVTFLFERARRHSDQRQPPALAVSWPRGLQVSDPVPVTVEVVADPKQFMNRAVLHYRRGSEPSFRRLKLNLSSRDKHQSISIPALAAPPKRSTTIQLYVAALDQRGNEVLTVGTPDAPREINLRYTQPPPWYGHWWVWAAAGTAVAAGTGALVFATTRGPPDTVAANGGAR